MTSANPAAPDQNAPTPPSDLDSAAAFDHSAALAAHLFEVPAAMVASASPDRRKVLSAVGWNGEEAERALPFCAHVCRADGLVVVEDVRADDRFAAHPLVVGEPGVRFFAGAPLTEADGQPGGRCSFSTLSRPCPPRRRFGNWSDWRQWRPRP